MRGKLDALIDILDVSLENALEDQEKKFLISYQNHVGEVQRDLEYLNANAQEEKFMQMKKDVIE